MTQKHAKEPWYVFEKTLLCRETEQDGSPRPGLVEMTEDTLRRIAACVNACAGMADPEAEVADLKAKSHPAA